MARDEFGGAADAITDVVEEGVKRFKRLMIAYINSMDATGPEPYTVDAIMAQGADIARDVYDATYSHLDSPALAHETLYRVKKRLKEI